MTALCFHEEDAPAAGSNGCGGHESEWPEQFGGSGRRLWPSDRLRKSNKKTSSANIDMKPSKPSGSGNRSSRTRTKSPNRHLALPKLAGRLLTVSCLLGGPAVLADTNSWTGTGADLNWSTVGNWTNGVPTAITDTIFGTNGAVSDTTTINNIVSANLTVQSLSYLHQNLVNAPGHNTQIADGVTLTVSDDLSNTNVFFVGTGANTLSGVKTTTTISGLEGTLSVEAPTGCVNVRNGGLGMYAGEAKLDLSGLGTFKTSVRQMLLGGDGINTKFVPGDYYKDRASCNVILARTNLLRLDAANAFGLVFASGIGNGAPGSKLLLGFTNAIFTDTGMLMGGPKAGISTVGFNEPGSFAYFRNTAGTGPQNYWGIGDTW